ncbi:MAG: pilus assembly PilX family protein [Lysobacter sp.]
MKRRTPSFHQHQRGAALYVALIFLVLLALIGVAGMQVAVLQERMSANYRTTNIAFQRAEAVSRTQEIVIETALGPDGIGSFVADQERCDPSFDPTTWAETQSSDAIGPNPTDDDGQVSRTRRIDTCTPGGSLGVGGAPMSEKTDLSYQITAFSTDQPADPSSDAAIDTTFIP